MLQWRTAADKNIEESQNHRPDPNLSLSLLAIFGELDTPDGVKAHRPFYSPFTIYDSPRQETCVRSGKSWIKRDAGITPLRFTQTDRTT
jgi:hypothetical protein